MPQLKRWYREETAMYWDEVQEEYTYDPCPDKYDCPFYEIENLVNGGYRRFVSNYRKSATSFPLSRISEDSMAQLILTQGET